MKTSENGFDHEDVVQTKPHGISLTAKAVEKKNVSLNIAGPCILNKGSSIPK